MPTTLTTQTPLPWADVADALHTLPDVLLARRTALDLSLRQVSAIVDLPEHVLARIEHGEPVFVHHLVPVMQWLDEP